MHLFTLAGFSDELEKIAWDSQGFKEGLLDEGIPLGGAVLGATLGHKSPLRGAALGYATGGGLSLLRERMKPKEKRRPMSTAQRVLGASALGYGAGGLAHGAIQKMVKPTSPQVMKTLFEHGKGPAKAMAEELLPATGATLATGVAMATRKKAHQTNTPGQGIGRDGRA